MIPLIDAQFNGEAGSLTGESDSDTPLVPGAGGKASFGFYDETNGLGASLEFGGGAHAFAPDFFARTDFSRAYGYTGFRAGLMGSPSGLEATATGGYRFEGGRNDHPYLGTEAAYTPIALGIVNFGPVIGAQIDPLQVFSSGGATEGAVIYVGVKFSTYLFSQSAVYAASAASCSPMR